MTQDEKIQTLKAALLQIQALPFRSVENDSIVRAALTAVTPETTYQPLVDLDLRVFAEFNVLGFDLNKGEYTFAADQSGIKMLIAALQKGMVELAKNQSNVIAATHIPPGMKNGRPH